MKAPMAVLGAVMWSVMQKLRPGIARRKLLASWMLALMLDVETRR